MTGGREIISLVAQRQDLEQFRRKSWEGTFEEYLDLVRRRARASTRNAFERVYDMILSYGTTSYEVGREKRLRFKFFDDPDDDGRDAVFGLDGPLQSPGQRLQERRPRLRHRKARAAAARPGRQQQEHDRPAARRKGWSAIRRRDDGALYTLGWTSLGRPEQHPLVPDARGAAAPRSRAVPRRDQRTSSTPGAARATTRSRSTASSAPSAAMSMPSGCKRYDGDWTRVVHDVRVKRLDPQREGPHRHRHVPAEGREEPGLDRADRRHQLPQDRRVRQRQRSAGVQLRRRIQRRQPRHHRVRRSAQARRGVPVRPARRQPGAQDQAEEVRPDRHRRGDPRPHERAGISPAAEQRVHGGPARSDGEDRRPVRHQAGRRDQDLREGLQHAKRCRGKHIAPHTIEMAAMWADSHAAGGAEERRA